MTRYYPGERAAAVAAFIGWLLLPVLLWFTAGAFVYWDLAWADQEARAGIVVFEFWWVLFWGLMVAIMEGV
jgi:hypothetical protein